MATFRVRDYGALGNGTGDDAPAINACIKAARAIPGPQEIIFDGADYTVGSSVRVDGFSDLRLIGAGKWNALRGLASLDGHDDGQQFKTSGAILSCLNFTGAAAGPYPYQNITVENLLFDGTAQNTKGIPAGIALGDNLCLCEFLNTDYVTIRACHFVGAFGNGAVIASQNPTQAAQVLMPIIDECVFDSCIRGLLPQYQLTGACIQLGACASGRVSNCTVRNTGGPFLEAFNCLALDMLSNTILSAVALTGVDLRTQAPGSLHSDFGLRDCRIIGNRWYGCGGIDLHGQTALTVFDGNIPTPGPIGCWIEGNTILNQGKMLPNYSGISLAGSWPGQAGVAINNWIVRNNIESPGRACVYLQRAADCIVSGNVLDNSLTKIPAIVLQNVQSSRLTPNLWASTQYIEQDALCSGNVTS